MKLAIVIDSRERACAIPTEPGLRAAAHRMFGPVAEVKGKYWAC
jgi:hypothetical protein